MKDQTIDELRFKEGKKVHGALSKFDYEGSKKKVKITNSYSYKYVHTSAIHKYAATSAIHLRAISV